MNRPENYILEGGIEVSAFRVTRDNVSRVSKWCRGETKLEWVESDHPKYDGIDLYIKVGAQEARPGDWVVLGVAQYSGWAVMTDEAFKSLAKKGNENG